MSRRLLTLALAAAAAIGIAPAAHAGILVADAPACDNGPTSQVFAPWGDPAQYFLAPDGGFEAGGAGWAIDGGAVTAGERDGGDGTQMLRLPSGASATTPTFCVGLEHPTNRFFVRRSGGSVLATLRVDAITELATGATVAVPVGLVPAGSGWAPSPVVVNVANLLPLLPGSHTPMRLRFTAQGGTFDVDDVHVDPYGRN
jgi:hypothetical protein